MSLPITATIITLNEEANIEATIASVQRVCDEVIVVDSCSTDKTQKLASALGAKVIVQPYLGDGAQKHHGVQFAKNDWILSIDADERLDENAVARIKELSLSSTSISAYAFKRKTFIGERWVKVWYPDWVTRLYHKERAAYELEIGHASVVGGEIKKLDCDMLHYSYAGYADLIGCIRKFAERGAKQLHAKGRRISRVSPFTHGFVRFLRFYLIKGGIFQGLDGFSVALDSGFLVYMKYLIALEMQERANKDKAVR
jgi:glycosyltransferase involved in cell wall biosynthesis